MVCYTSAVLRWPEFRRARPDLAEGGRALLYQFGVGLAFLATTRPDGRPRVHPMCPIVTDEGLFAFIVPSLKRDDLIRDGCYAMHCFSPAQNEDAFYFTGLAVAHSEGKLRDAIAQVFFDERKITEPPPDFEEEGLFEFLPDSCLLTRTTGHGDYNPQHTVWKAGRG
jgi:hypothetical protein